jgi:deoxyribodipyrimidine photo-lyase
MILTLNGEPYKKFTPFYENVLTMPVLKPISGEHEGKLVTLEGTITLAEAWKKMVKPNPSIMVHGGRELGLKMMKNGVKSQKGYAITRDYLAQSTSGLSAYLKFGCISVREFYWTFHKNKELIRQLIWRDYYAHVLYGFPSVLSGSYQPKYQNIHWRHSEVDFEKWKNGKTGFPVVDAGMRQLNATGYMHNRCRMVTATFLIKVLMIDWQLGEQYFAQKLTDYDPASNNGNWQGISGTGTDMKPYYRTMSPWIQSYKFDRECEYIKKWIPELVDVPPNDIHKWDMKWNMYTSSGYPKPMVDFKEQTDKMMKMYKD